MWFKQLKLFEASSALANDADEVEKQLEPFVFTPCLPTFSHSYGWVSPIEVDEAPLVHVANRRYIMLCMQLEEKILPTTVINQSLHQQVKKLEKAQGRQVRYKEKARLKDEITQTLLPRALSKLSRHYVYIDTQNQWLITHQTSDFKLEKLLTLLKKSLMLSDIQPIETTAMQPILTQWLMHQRVPSTLSLEKACLLVDPNQSNRTIRCQHQDLSAEAIQAFVKEGCQVNQLAMNWKDAIQFTLCDDLTLKNIRYSDDITAQTKEELIEDRSQAFDVNFFLMTETLDPLIEELVHYFQQEDK